MKTYLIKNAGLIMTRLLTKEDFDDYYLVEAAIVGANSFIIDGKKQAEFFDSDDEELLEGGAYRKWGRIKNICRDIIRGKKTPLKISIVLSNDINVEYLLMLRYDGEKIRLVTGTSLKSFSLDKGPEKEWDQQAGMLLSSLGIDYEEE